MKQYRIPFTLEELFILSNAMQADVLKNANESHTALCDKIAKVFHDAVNYEGREENGENTLEKNDES